MIELTDLPTWLHCRSITAWKHNPGIVIVGDVHLLPGQRIEWEQERTVAVRGSVLGLQVKTEP